MTDNARENPGPGDAQERDEYLIEAMNRTLSQLLEERQEAERQAAKAELAAVAARGHATEIEKMILALAQFLGQDAEELTAKKQDD